MKYKNDAIAALEKSVALKEDAERMMQDAGITEMLKEADELKKEVTNFCKSKGIERLDLVGGRYGQMIQAVQQRFWVGTKDDLPADAPKGVKPLKSILPKDLWMKVSRRVVDPERVEKAIATGEITIEQVEPCYYEKMRAPYLRVFASNGEA